MSDFDERLSAVLEAESVHAPPGAGLAREARRRHVVRRRRRVAVGTVAAALVVAAPVALLAGGGDDEAEVATDPPAGEWRTVTHDGVSVEVPVDWQEHSCDFDGFTTEVWGPTEEDACEFGSYLAFYGSATFDPVHGPDRVRKELDGDIVRWSGYVFADDYAAVASTTDRDLTERILESVDLTDDGEPVRLTTFAVAGILVDAPDTWRHRECAGEPAEHWIGPGEERCGASPHITLHAAASFDPLMGQGEIISGDEDGATLWIGYRIVGDWAVVVSTSDRQLTEEILATVR